MYRELYEKRFHVIDGLKDSAKSREIIRAAVKRSVNKLDPKDFDLNFDKGKKQRLLK